jgi:anti-anti-sigma factor
MAIQSGPQDVVVVSVRSECHKSDELNAAVETTRNSRDHHVVIDFSDVDVVGSPILARLLELRELMQDGEHSMILCGVNPRVKGVFAVARLDDAFEFAEDKTAALARLHR